jgi:arylformamidase
MGYRVLQQLVVRFRMPRSAFGKNLQTGCKSCRDACRATHKKETEMKSWGKTSSRCTIIVASILLLMWQVSFAGPLRDRIIERRAAQDPGETMDEGATSQEPATLPAGIRITRDVSYGSDKQQCFDVYSPKEAKGAPVIYMVHGGAWFLGDKAAGAVVENKVAHWVPRGFVVVSTNYRLLPKADPREQARDVARALAAAQDKAASWGGDRAKFILMGHSAGAHLIALMATDPSLCVGIVSTPWLGAVLLDSAALDVVKIMEARHARFYDRAFGRDPAFWKSASPYDALAGAGKPILAVCSTQRADSCPQADRFVQKASSLGMRASVLGQNLSHKEINQRLGDDERYTDAVESFIYNLDDSVAKKLTKRSSGPLARGVH